MLSAGFFFSVEVLKGYEVTCTSRVSADTHDSVQFCCAEHVALFTMVLDYCYESSIFAQSSSVFLLTQPAERSVVPVSMPNLFSKYLNCMTEWLA